jgi:FkbM family methyltransferase
MKLYMICFSRPLIWQLVKNRVLAGVEHKEILNRKIQTVVDIGANKGQFSLAASEYTDAKIYAFEPLPDPARTFRKVFHDRKNVRLFEYAISDKSGTTEMHISGKEDSSSLLKIGELQSEHFPGTQEVGTVQIESAPLINFIASDDLTETSLLKLDVQGFELQALKGCQPLLSQFSYIYCECSYIALYEGQALVTEVITFLENSGFQLSGVYNTQVDHLGNHIQADFMFSNKAS